VFAGALVASATWALASSATNSLVVTDAPDYVRPYVLRKGGGPNVRVGQQIYRFSVTGNSSGGAFTLLQTNAPDSTALGVLPHVHKLHHENFYCTKGRVQLWAKLDVNGSEEQSRILTQGDYGTVPHNTIHTYQILDPDTQLTGVIQPGGFEKLFFASGDGTFDTSTFTPFDPVESSTAAGAGASADTISALESFDVHAHLEFTPRTDVVNGIGGSGNWHNGSNSLAPDGYTPNFIAKNYGPKYLNTEHGFYHVIAPLVTGAQTTNNFTMGTMSLSPKLVNETARAVTAKQHLALQLQEGELIVAINNETARLIDGDVVFIPGGTPFSYFASVPFTKFLYVSAGGDGFDAELLANSVAWNFTTYPAHAGYNAVA